MNLWHRLGPVLKPWYDEISMPKPVEKSTQCFVEVHFAVGCKSYCP